MEKPDLSFVPMTRYPIEDQITITAVSNNSNFFHPFSCFSTANGLILLIGDSRDIHYLAMSLARPAVVCRKLSNISGQLITAIRVEAAAAASAMPFGVSCLIRITRTARDTAVHPLFTLLNTHAAFRRHDHLHRPVTMHA